MTKNINYSACKVNHSKYGYTYLSMKLLSRSKQGAFLGGHGLSAHNSSSSWDPSLDCPSPCLSPYLGVKEWGPYIFVRNMVPACGLEAL